MVHLGTLRTFRRGYTRKNVVIRAATPTLVHDGSLVVKRDAPRHIWPHIRPANRCACVKLRTCPADTVCGYIFQRVFAPEKLQERPCLGTRRAHAKNFATSQRGCIPFSLVLWSFGDTSLENSQRGGRRSVRLDAGCGAVVKGRSLLFFEDFLVGWLKLWEQRIVLAVVWCRRCFLFRGSCGYQSKVLHHLSFLIFPEIILSLLSRTSITIWQGIFESALSRWDIWGWGCLYRIRFMIDCFFSFVPKGGVVILQEKFSILQENFF